jgi:tetratricopeptide (TPR) repeat protein
MKRLGPTLVTSLVIAHAAAAEPLKPAAPEIATPAAKLALPPIPTFAVPAVDAGIHDPRELRIAGRAVLDTEIQVRGYIVWIYSCPRDVGKPGEKPADVQKRIDADPTLCERPKLYLGATKDTRPERGLWVVDVPRAPNVLEKQGLSRAELASWPKVPKLALGDHVVVTGTWKLASAHGERNSDGLLVWKSIAPAAAGTTPPPTEAVDAPVMLPGLPPPPTAEAPVAVKLRARSITELNACSAAIVQKHFADGITRCEHALAIWPGNHLARYTLAVAASSTGDWKRAVEAASAAVDMRADAPQYQMILGVALYERAVADARAANVELAKVNWEEARALLTIATAQEPRLWRAHYYLGRILRETGHPHAAADALGTTLTLNPAQPGPYIALAELYRKWDALDPAIAIAQQGTANAPTADLFLVLGLGLDDKGQLPGAIEAYTHALAIDPDHAKSRFQRGVDYFHAGDLANAKLDLEAVAASAALPVLAKQVATSILLDLAAKPA